MGLFSGSKSNSTTTTTTINHDDDQMLNNSGNGLQILGSDRAVIDVNYLSDGVAKAAIEEAGIFAETASSFASGVLKSNTSFMKDIFKSNNNLMSSVLSASPNTKATPNDGMVKVLAFGSVAVIGAVLVLGAVKS